MFFGYDEESNDNGYCFKFLVVFMLPPKCEESIDERLVRRWLLPIDVLDCMKE